VSRSSIGPIGASSKLIQPETRRNLLVNVSSAASCRPQLAKLESPARWRCRNGSHGRGEERDSDLCLPEMR
jgi:hypothetical protein